jgi:branched-chain amino acid transport system ATP-binding protein
MLRAVDVSRSFDGVIALADVTLELGKHEVVGLIGPNGAGKSTLVNVMTGFDQPDGGSVVFEGENITSWPPHRRGRAGLARTFQRAHAFAGLSVRENIEVSALGCGANAAEAARRADRLLILLDLAPIEDVPASIVPHGAERKLGVARALATEPRFVLMDEPAAGLNEAEVPEFADVVRSVVDEHDAGVLLIDHNMALVMAVTDRIHVLDEGHTIAEGTPAEIRQNRTVADAYLGRSAKGGRDG